MWNLCAYALELEVHSRHEAYLAEAARERLLREAGRRQQGRGGVRLRLKRWLGERLVRWGTKLQTGDRSQPATLPPAGPPGAAAGAACAPAEAAPAG